MNVHKLLLGGLLPLMMMGFAESQAAAATATGIPPRPLGQDLTLAGPIDLQASLTLSQALVLALRQNPELKSFAWEVRAREANQLQAGLWPNPQIALLSEDVAGSAAFVPRDFTQSTLELSQLIRMGNKLELQQQVAQLNKTLADWDYETKRLDILTKVKGLFIEVLTNQEYLSLSQSSLQVAQEVLKAVSLRVEAGKISPIEEIRARINLSNSQVELERSRIALQTAKGRLSQMWGQASAKFQRVIGDFYQVQEVPTVADLFRVMKQNPDVARWDTENAQREKSVALEKAQAIPDISVVGAVRYHHQSQDTGLVVGVGIPMPVFDQNQGNVHQAEHLLQKSKQQQSNALLNTETEILNTYEQLAGNLIAVKKLRDEVLPNAQKTFVAIRDGFYYGKFSYLDVLNAQQTLLETQRQYIQSLALYHVAVTDMERLISQPLAKTMGLQKETKP